MGVIAPERVEVRSADGVVLTAYDHGGDGPDLILGHATGFHGRYWDPIVARIGERYRRVAVDFRGHGDTRLPLGVRVDWWKMAVDLLAVIDHLGLDDLSGVGHSMGGTGIVMAELSRPGTFRSAWLFEPILFPSEPPEAATGANPLADSARRRRETFPSREAAYERYASRPPFERVAPEALAAYVDFGFEDLPDGTVRLKCRGETEAETFESSATGVFDRLGEVAMPTTIAGSADRDRPARIAPGVARRMPNANYESYPDLTHFGPMEAPDRIADAIVAALG